MSEAVVQQKDVALALRVVVFADGSQQDIVNRVGLALANAGMPSLVEAEEFIVGTLTVMSNG